ncbi:6-aminohexanoate-dimer hydrolase [Poriferisphaera corsica]|uniref:6-aminohexanoate-dimer hydrolase n=1 Tax=Poriferisphaera corsica TaxID=2528020 RepID=A0A517YSC8_9BACT|nr:serine hydrolase [Poriferisphaera corsica]QDU33124.1 6-aminohexanoate-dimer hydrolase [Poriferisphaera corsica]
MACALILSEFVEEIGRRGLGVKHVNVRVKGEMVGEYDFEEVKPRLLWSVSKAVTALGVGIAIDEGLFGLKDCVVEFFEGYEIVDERKKRVTVRDLLVMATGHRKCGLSTVPWEEGVDVDFAEYFFDMPMVIEPGEKFVYDNSATYMLSRIMEVVTGELLEDFVYERILRKLGIEKPYWERCPKGHTFGFSGLHLTARDLSKVGQLMLDGGAWEGEEVVPSWFIEEMGKCQIDNTTHEKEKGIVEHHAGYGYQVWLNSRVPGSYRMDGARGQYCIVLPDEEAVVTVLSDQEDEPLDILVVVWETLLDKIRE